ncbi:hypothetical protein ROJ8625_02390 [Roseivivax jejudonensis]|uniref:Uncharacterized protein n=1 Tax=Roseivivax jejudonensis TaxID=1529041 RepID=A0A1X6ZDQ0_9RHOB|nr:hypothetical protein [Roseivivax jejudonensis]SLN48845.1 hypothetical protein ROJ8625_02390 [Roseivivax jejudonensis]
MRRILLALVCCAVLPTGGMAQNEGQTANPVQTQELSQAVNALAVLLNRMNQSNATSTIVSPQGTALTCTRYCKDCQTCEAYCCQGTNTDDLDLVIVTDDEP